MRRLAHWLFEIGHGCGRLPLIAALALVLSARTAPMWALPPDPVGEPVVQGAIPADAEIIDAVLTKRGPELGLTLRQQLTVAISEEADRAGYDPLLVLAIIDVESDFDEDARSNKGARGLMQIKPSTLHFVAQKEGLRLSREEVVADPALCVRLGVRYLRRLHDQFGDLDLALMAYNAGPTRIRSAMKQGPVPEVFQRYPELVRRDFLKFREGAGLGGDWALAARSQPPAGPFPDQPDRASRP